MRRRSVFVAALAVVLSACGKTDAETGGEPIRERAREAREDAEITCDLFERAMNDLRDGVLTDDELRGRVKEVEVLARQTTHSGIADGARELLAAVTARDAKPTHMALAKLTVACTRFRRKA